MMGEPHGQEEISDIVILCQNADVVDFGAALHTTIGQSEDETPYYRHSLVNVEAGGAAKQMKIENKHEIVFLNQMLAPSLPHKGLLNQFYHLKIDGNAPLTLVLQRTKNRKAWEWIETSAILAAKENNDNASIIDLRRAFHRIMSFPEKLLTFLQTNFSIQPKHLQSGFSTLDWSSPSLKYEKKKEIERYLNVENLEFKELKGERIEIPMSKYVYKITDTPHFLEISNGSVYTNTVGTHSDRTKIICRRVQYWNSDGKVDYAAALCDETMSWYIAVDRQNKIVLNNKPLWFKMGWRGTKVHFKVNDLYLGYSKGGTQMKLDETRCTFDQISLSHFDRKFRRNGKRLQHMGRNSDSLLFERAQRLCTVPSGVKMLPRLLKLFVR